MGMTMPLLAQGPETARFENLVDTLALIPNTTSVFSREGSQGLRHFVRSLGAEVSRTARPETFVRSFAIYTRQTPSGATASAVAAASAVRNFLTIGGNPGRFEAMISNRYFYVDWSSDASTLTRIRSLLGRYQMASATGPWLSALNYPGYLAAVKRQLLLLFVLSQHQIPNSDQLTENQLSALSNSEGIGSILRVVHNNAMSPSYRQLLLAVDSDVFQIFARNLQLLTTSSHEFINIFVNISDRWQWVQSWLMSHVNRMGRSGSNAQQDIAAFFRTFGVQNFACAIRGLGSVGVRDVRALLNWAERPALQSVFCSEYFHRTIVNLNRPPLRLIGPEATIGYLAELLNLTTMSSPNYRGALPNDREINARLSWIALDGIGRILMNLSQYGIRGHSALELILRYGDAGLRILSDENEVVQLVDSASGRRVLNNALAPWGIALRGEHYEQIFLPKLPEILSQRSDVHLLPNLFNWCLVRQELNNSGFCRLTLGENTPNVLLYQEIGRSFSSFTLFSLQEPSYGAYGNPQNQTSKWVFFEENTLANIHQILRQQCNGAQSMQIWPRNEFADIRNRPLRWYLGAGADYNSFFHAEDTIDSAGDQRKQAVATCYYDRQ